jgi:rhodanese-related sulfurtransferase
MKQWLYSIVFTLCSLVFGCAQTPPDKLPEIGNPAFNKKLLSLLHFSSPLMGVKELKQRMPSENWLVLDAREWEEYQVSHIPGAQFAGYQKFQLDQWSDLPKNTPIVVYCSVGYRSEKITKKLKTAGFSQVFNLYGSIFEWVNQGYPVENAAGQPTMQIHTYNKDWSRWVDNPQVIKTW